MFDNLSRRDFLHTSGSLAAVALAGATGGCERIWRRIRERPLRRDISTLAANDPDLQAYKDAVLAMQALPASDPRNWTKQAEIHFNHCPHGNWYFLPWHRAYLFYFEDICRELSGYADFALPYWNWSKSPSIPAAFWGSGNPLFNTTRWATQTDQAPASAVSDPVIQAIVDEPNFFVFASDQAVGQRDIGGYGELEGNPHNTIHGFVGGDMGTYMSPLDPIFWCHHNMIDCLWVEWNINRQHPNTNDTQWTDFNFIGNFVNRNGNPVDIKIITTILMPLISYRYTPCCEKPAPMAQLDSAALRRFLEAGAPVRLEFLQRFELRRGIEAAIGGPATAAVPIDRESFRSALAADAPNRLLLIVGGVTQPAEEDFFVRVFLGKPDATAETPTEDPHYAGSFAFFNGGDHAHGSGKARFLVDVTDTVRRLTTMGVAASDAVDVRLVAVPFSGRTPRATSFALERIELGISPIEPVEQTPKP